MQTETGGVADGENPSIVGNKIATSFDVAQTYLLLLARAAENQDVIAEKVGQDQISMLRGFLGSAEFRNGALASLLGRPGASRLKPITPATDRWARGFFGITPSADPIGTRQATAKLFLDIFSQSIFATALDDTVGMGTAADCVVGARAIASASPDDEVDGTTSEDLENLYLLVHDRPAESLTVTRPRPDDPLEEILADFLASREFAPRIIQLAVGGGDLPLASGIADWAHRRLGSDPGTNIGRNELLGNLIERSAERLRARPLLWSVDEIVAALRDIRHPSAGIMHRLQKLCSGAQIKNISGISATELGESIQLSNDAWITLEPNDLKADYLEIEMRMTLERRNLRGAFYVDYGGGFTHGTIIHFHYDIRGYARVVIPITRDLKMLRWDPSEVSGHGKIISIDVRTFETGDGEISRRDPRALLADLTEQMREDGLVPLGTALARTLSNSPNRFEQWAAENEPIGANARRIWDAQLAGLKERPLISVLMPTYNTDERLLSEAIDSVLAQVYPNWELCIADDASTAPHVRAVLNRYAARDKRIKVKFRRKNGHIAEASNSALDLVSGDWVALLDHDDLYTPNALLAVAEEIQRYPGAQLIYSDEDKMSETGHRQHPYFKADFSPELLLAQNYINHLTVHRTSNLRALGGWRKGFEGSQDWDITLRVIERAPPETIRHIPQILYHWRETPGSTALNVSEKSYAVHAGLKSVKEHLARTGQSASIDILPTMAFNRVRYTIPNPPPKVSLIIPTRDRVDLLRMSVGSILDHSTYSDFEILIVDNGSTEKETLTYFAELSGDSRIRVIPYLEAFNFSAINNLAAEQATGDVLGLVNNDIEVITPDWIEELVSWAIQPAIGCVGAKLYYPDGRIQHAGVVLGIGQLAGHGHKLSPQDSIGHFGRLKLHNNVSAVTGACLFVRRSVYEEVGGLDPEFAVAFNDVDFCIKVREAGYRNVFTPYAELVHHESLSRGYEDTPEKARRLRLEGYRLKEKWGEILLNDPFYSPNLTLDREDYSIGESPFYKEYSTMAAPR